MRLVEPLQWYVLMSCVMPGYAVTHVVIILQQPCATALEKGMLAALHLMVMQAMYGTARLQT